MKKIKVLLMFALILAPTGCKRATAFFNGGKATSETLVCHYERPLRGGIPVFSADGKHVAYVSSEDGQYTVVVDGKRGKSGNFVGESEVYGGGSPVFEQIPPVFSPNGQRLAYAALSPNGTDKWVVMLDGREDGAFTRVYARTLTFSPDSTRLAFLVSTDAAALSIVVDGKVEGQYQSAGAPFFSLDGRRLAYHAQLGGKWFVVVNGKNGSPYDELDARPPVFSPDSQRLAYAARVGKSWFVVLDGTEEKRYDEIGEIVFSPDSKRLAYEARTGEKWSVVVDGKEGPSYNPRAMTRGGTRMEIGGTYEESAIVFSPDSRHVAYTAKSGKKWVVVVDGKEGKTYDVVGVADTISTGDDSASYYLAKRPVFSPEGQRVAFSAKAGDKWIVVVDGKEGKPYDYAGTPDFSPDSQHLAFWAGVGGKWLVVVDGKEGKQYDDRWSAVAFDSANELHFLAQANTAKDGRSFDVFRVEETVY